MQTIHKYTISSDGYQTINASAVFIDVIAQNEDIVTYATVETSCTDTEEVKFHVIPTGGNIPHGENTTLTYLGTVPMYGAALVYHIFVEFLG